MIQHRRWNLAVATAILSPFICRPAVSFISLSSLRQRRHKLATSDTTLFEGDKKKNLSASEKEQRDEETRRRQRKEDVVIGKTSAKKGEKDFALDPKATEQEYLRQASRIDREIFLLTETGMECLNSVGDCVHLAP